MGSDFKVVFTADLMGGKASVQKCGYAVVNGAMVQFGEMWTYGCTVDSHFDYTHSKLINPGWALSRPLSLSIGTNGGTASFSSSSVTYQFVSFPKAASLSWILMVPLLASTLVVVLLLALWSRKSQSGPVRGPGRMEGV
jgi:hypothetical protein